MDTRRSLQKIFIEEKRRGGMTQAAIARLLNTHRSVIHRELAGQKDMTLGRVAELAWALGREAQVIFPKPVVAEGQNSRADPKPSPPRRDAALTSDDNKGYKLTESPTSEGKSRLLEMSGWGR
jgi:hypothetical protein